MDTVEEGEQRLMVPIVQQMHPLSDQPDSRKPETVRLKHVSWNCGTATTDQPSNFSR
jgi:hypothetical protein